MNLVLILASVFLALGAAVNGGSPQIQTAAAVTSVADAVPAAVPTPTPAPTPADIISGGGPT